MSPVRLARPTVNTPFHIDLAWWQRNQRDFRSFLLDALCAECRDRFPAGTQVQEADYVDPSTGEVRRLDEVWGCLVTVCSRQPGFLSTELPLATALFRALLATGNAPLTPAELQRHIGRSNPQTILRVLTGPVSILGIAPVE